MFLWFILAFVLLCLQNVCVSHLSFCALKNFDYETVKHFRNLVLVKTFTISEYSQPKVYR